MASCKIQEARRRQDLQGDERYEGLARMDIVTKTATWQEVPLEFHDR